MHNNQNNNVKGRHAIEERRRRVASLLAQCKTETEIGAMLGVDQGTISHDIKVLKQMSQEFVFGLAKSDLAYHYQQCIERIEQATRKAWDMLDNDSRLAEKDKLLALKIIIDASQAKFSLFEKGPEILSINTLEDRVSRVEMRNNSNNNDNNDSSELQPWQNYNKTF
jgi:hypothetical protein